VSNFSDFIGGGGGGAVIGEYVGFPAQGNSFTDENGAVWLKSGASTFDTTTYPDAPTLTKVLHKSTYAKSTSAWFYKSSPISVSGDWVIQINTSTNGRYAQMKKSTGVVAYNNAVFPLNRGGYYSYVAAYIECNGPNIISQISNTDDKFAVFLGGHLDGHSSQRLFLNSAYLNTQSNLAGIPATWVNEVRLVTNTGADITVGGYGGLHWDGSNKKLYVLDGGKLYTYNLTGQTWGTSTASFSGSVIYAESAAIDWKAEDSNIGTIYGMTSTATHLYVPVYYNVGGEAIHKIPLSGNLSWASGTQIFSGTNQGLYIQDSSGNVTYDNNYLSSGSLGFSGMDGSQEKFIRAKNNDLKLYEHTFAGLIGGSTPSEVGPATGVTFYQRIK